MAGMVEVDQSIAELGRMLRAGETTAVALGEEALQRLDTVGRSLNAVAALTPDHALAEARLADAELAAGLDRGPLHGIPYGAKDLLATAGIPTTWGAAPFKGQVFDRDATVVTRLREAGAVMVAKLAMVEIAGGFGYEQPNAAWTGPGLSAWDRNRWSGGSSSGSGSAVGSGCVPFAIGTETWGSIHSPATFNGITGLRPTYGRVSRTGAMALSWTMDKIGPMARSVEDCWTVLQAIAGPDGLDDSVFEEPLGEVRTEPGRFRVAVVRGATRGIQPGVAIDFEAALKVLGVYADLEEVELPDYPYDAVATVMINVEGASAFEEFIRAGKGAELTAPEDRTGLIDGLGIPAVDYVRALRIRGVAARAWVERFAGFDAVVAPGYALVAPLIDRPFREGWPSDTGPGLGAVGNLLGLPSACLPMGFGQDSMPTSLEVMGLARQEARVVEVARGYQARTDWHLRRPGRVRLRG